MSRGYFKLNPKIPKVEICLSFFRWEKLSKEKVISFTKVKFHSKSENMK